MLHHLAQYACQRDGPIIGRVTFLTFLQNWTYVGFGPVRWECTIGKGFFENQFHSGIVLLLEWAHPTPPECFKIILFTGSPVYMPLFSFLWMVLLTHQKYFPILLNSKLRTTSVRTILTRVLLWQMWSSWYPTPP